MITKNKNCPNQISTKDWTTSKIELKEFIELCDENAYQIDIQIFLPNGKFKFLAPNFIVLFPCFGRLKNRYGKIDKYRVQKSVLLYEQKTKAWKAHNIWEFIASNPLSQPLEMNHPFIIRFPFNLLEFPHKELLDFSQNYLTKMRKILQGMGLLSDKRKPPIKSERDAFIIAQYKKWIKKTGKINPYPLNRILDSWQEHCIKKFGEVNSEKYECDPMTVRRTLDAWREK